jgi:hypothetical protein
VQLIFGEILIEFFNGEAFAISLKETVKVFLDAELGINPVIKLFDIDFKYFV